MPCATPEGCADVLDHLPTVFRVRQIRPGNRGVPGGETMSGPNLMIPLAIAPHPPAALMAACVRDANAAFEAGRQDYIRNVMHLAQYVSNAEKYARKSGVSFRSLFRDDGEGSGQQVDRPTFVFSRSKGIARVRRREPSVT
jgi:hypothetical protein